MGGTNRKVPANILDEAKRYLELALNSKIEFAASSGMLMITDDDVSSIAGPIEELAVRRVTWCMTTLKLAPNLRNRVEEMLKMLAICKKRNIFSHEK